jgi:hypothetical protein
MTERRPSLRAVGAASLAAFVVVLALLVAQMRLGRDPVLGAGRAAAPIAPASRRVLVRRVIVKRIVVREIDDADDSGATAPVRVAVAPTRTAAPAPTRTAAPAPPTSIPAPAPAPTPAPAPAPLVTKSS